MSVSLSSTCWPLAWWRHVCEGAGTRSPSPLAQTSLFSKINDCLYWRTTIDYYNEGELITLIYKYLKTSIFFFQIKFSWLKWLYLTLLHTQTLNYSGKLGIRHIFPPDSHSALRAREESVNWTLSRFQCPTFCSEAAATPSSGFVHLAPTLLIQLWTGLYFQQLCCWFSCRDNADCALLWQKE